MTKKSTGTKKKVAAEAVQAPVAPAANTGESIIGRAADVVSQARTRVARTDFKTAAFKTAAKATEVTGNVVQLARDNPTKAAVVGAVGLGVSMLGFAAIIPAAIVGAVASTEGGREGLKELAKRGLGDVGGVVGKIRNSLEDDKLKREQQELETRLAEIQAKRNGKPGANGPS